MNIILKNEYTKDDFPKKITIYKNGEIVKIVHMKVENKIKLNSDIASIKIVINNNLGENIKDKIISFIMIIIGLLFNTNGEEIFTYPYEYEIEFECTNKNIEVIFTGDLENPFWSDYNINSNFSYIEKKIYKKWVKAIIVFITIIGLVTSSFIFLSENIYFNIILVLFIFTYISYIIFKLHSAKKNIKDSF